MFITRVGEGLGDKAVAGSRSTQILAAGVPRRMLRRSEPEANILN